MEDSLPHMDAAADRAGALMRPLLSAHDSAITAALSEVSERTAAVAAAEAALAAHQAPAPPLVAWAARMPPVNYPALVAGGAVGSGTTPPTAAAAALATTAAIAAAVEAAEVALSAAEVSSAAALQAKADWKVEVGPAAITSFSGKCFKLNARYCAGCNIKF